ncbi:hypothetical protein FB45DRAFT_921301 [Roridomyces roridus]|uniref:Uncharacterized protein n=1 Tax=Roridomyces roridus TaxID=1738132 RepID=A0AAD7BQ77_9AGAR|nr:hypothetical protein FB45DRAFT_921301 [Roridomyces roridus]
MQAHNPASSTDHMLYLPGRTIPLNNNRSHLLAFGPMYRYGKNQWVKASDLIPFNGSTREVFIQHHEFILYLGTYRCHLLNNVFPEGTIPPPTISVKELTDATFLGGRPPG